MPRPSPSESATQYKVGTKKRGNDGNFWTITATATGVKRWTKTTTKTKTKAAKTATIADLNKLKKKYSVESTGSANDIWRISGNRMTSANIAAILPLLSSNNQKQANKLLNEREEKPITDYKGMWKKAKKPISTMTRSELIRNIMSFVNTWEKITTRSMDTSEEGLKELSLQQLRKRLQWYHSDAARLLAEGWLRHPAKIPAWKRLLGVF